LAPCAGLDPLDQGLDCALAGEPGNDGNAELRAGSEPGLLLGARPGALPGRLPGLLLGNAGGRDIPGCEGSGGGALAPGGTEGRSPGRETAGLAGACSIAACAWTSSRALTVLTGSRSSNAERPESSPVPSASLCIGWSLISLRAALATRTSYIVGLCPKTARPRNTNVGAFSRFSCLKPPTFLLTARESGSAQRPRDAPRPPATHAPGRWPRDAHGG